MVQHAHMHTTAVQALGTTQLHPMLHIFVIVELLLQLPLRSDSQIVRKSCSQSTQLACGPDFPMVPNHSRIHDSQLLNRRRLDLPQACANARGGPSSSPAATESGPKWSDRQPDGMLRMREPHVLTVLADGGKRDQEVIHRPIARWEAGVSCDLRAGRASTEPNSL